MQPDRSSWYPTPKRQRLGEPDAPIDTQPCATTFDNNPAKLPYDFHYTHLVSTHGEQATKNDEKMCCFGVVTSIAARCDRIPLEVSQFCIQLETFETFTCIDFPSVYGSIEPSHGPLISGLLNEKSLILCASCSPDVESAPQKSASVFSQMRCILAITIYGPQELFSEIGEWFQSYDVYLQDPTACHYDLPYCNPHRLSSLVLDLCPLVSQVVSNSARLLPLQEVLERPDFLDLLSGQDDLDETQPHRSISATLHRHQKQALTFMMSRERGWNLQRTAFDMWGTYDTSNERVFINRISMDHQIEPPPQFRGGIIADPMGLGKTLTMIALIAADLGQPDIGDRIWPTGGHSQSCSNVTLIVVPQPLLSSWEEQILNHTRANTVRYRRHHGKDRIHAAKDVESFDIVLTTYHTLSADWNGHDERRRTVFSIEWRRIVLDEAHIIRNMKTRMARALCDLKASARWAVTGTPIQNNLSDLSGLLKFIRAHPYDDVKKFEAHFSQLWKTQQEEEAVKRLKHLARCLILRRPKRAISLPPRRDLKCGVKFTTEERKLYEGVRQQAITRIEDVLVSDNEITRTNIYVNFLQQIETMRLICNLGLHYHTRHTNTTSHQAAAWVTVAQETFNTQRGLITITCSQCSSFLDETGYVAEDGQTYEDPTFSQCLKYACADCTHKLKRLGHGMVCGHTPRCPIASVSLDGSTSESTQHRAQHFGSLPVSSILPSKVNALVQDLEGLPTGTKSIVFSTWRMTLDVVELGLNRAGIRVARFDGKVPQVQRQSVLDSFRRDPDIQVLLLTLQSGAVGLTLTEASRAYLLEPHWNPTVEEQALARVHRIGQTREVTTVRFYIKDSFEEKIMETQDSKKNLASILLSSHDGGHADDSLGALQRLRDLL